MSPIFRRALVLIAEDGWFNLSSLRAHGVGLIIDPVALLLGAAGG